LFYHRVFWPGQTDVNKNTIVAGYQLLILINPVDVNKSDTVQIPWFTDVDSDGVETLSPVELKAPGLMPTRVRYAQFFSTLTSKKERSLLFCAQIWVETPTLIFSRTEAALRSSAKFGPLLRVPHQRSALS